MSITQQKFSLFLILWVTANVCVANPELTSHTSDDLSTLLESRLAKSTRMVIHHIPSIAIGYRLRSRENIREDWKYRIEINCAITCAERTQSSLKKFVVAAKKQSNDCPIPLNTLVMAIDEQNNTILELFIHQSGQCLVLDGQSYFSTFQFDPIDEFTNM